MLKYSSTLILSEMEKEILKEKKPYWSELITFELINCRLFVDGHYIMDHVSEDTFNRLAEIINSDFSDSLFRIVDVKREYYRRVTIYLDLQGVE